MLQDAIDRYLLSLITTRSPQTVSWYRKRLQPLRSLSQNISAITLSDLQALYAPLATRSARWVNHPSGRCAEPGGLSPATLRGYVFYARWDAAELHALHDRYTWLRGEP